MNARWNVLFIAAAAILISNSGASAQTKDQCADVTRALIPLQTTIDQAGEKMAQLPKIFDVISSNVSGNFKNAAEEAKAAQANFVASIVRFRIAIEDVTREAQLCAR
jgi:hypothetical protein